MKAGRRKSYHKPAVGLVIGCIGADGTVSAQRRTGHSRTERSGEGHSRKAAESRPVWSPSECYKLGTQIDDVQLDFLNTGFLWPQPNGPGSSITITYSYSNLLDGQLIGVSPDQARLSVENALMLWSSVAPLDFVEDAGPLPSSADTGYPSSGTADIRFGHHTIDGANGGALARACLVILVFDGVYEYVTEDVSQAMIRLSLMATRYTYGARYLSTAFPSPTGSMSSTDFLDHADSGTSS